MIQNLCLDAPEQVSELLRAGELLAGGSDEDVLGHRPAHEDAVVTCTLGRPKTTMAASGPSAGPQPIELNRYGMGGSSEPCGRLSDKDGRFSYVVGRFVAPLEGLGPDYMITGGVASVIYGDPRFTRDIDLVLGVHVYYCPDTRPSPQGESTRWVGFGLL